jgi:SAM-dependent methyltransferase
MQDSDIRSPHADLDLATRSAKARKILQLLRGRVELKGAKALEVGTGSGVIAEALKQEVGSGGEVWAVDVVDQRVHRDAVHFVAVANTTLPFEDGSFDLAVSNHVIEHVGDLAAQHDHLEELARVLRPAGALYLATPNRWAPVEPHFKLPLLSWLPEDRRSAYVRAARRGPRYDCRPLTRSELVKLFQAHGFVYLDLSREAMRVMGEVEEPPLLTRAALRLADSLFPVVRRILPSFIFLAKRR